jgi:hypothetical protein
MLLLTTVTAVDWSSRWKIFVSSLAAEAGDDASLTMAQGRALKLSV